MIQQPNPKKDEPGVDMTEVMAAVAKLNNEPPPTSPVIVPASVFPDLEADILKKAAEAAARAAEEEERKRQEAEWAAYDPEKKWAPDFNEEEKAAAYEDPEIGNMQDDGTVYAGALPNGEKLFTMGQDAESPDGYLQMSFKEAAKYAKKLNKGYCDHDDWRLPTLTESHLLYKARDKGYLTRTFDEDGSNVQRGKYWTSTPDPDHRGWVEVKSFNSGTGYHTGYPTESGGFLSKNKGFFFAARFVRSEPPKP